MKELEKQEQDKVHAISEIPIKRELKLLGQLKPHKGHRCYELNLKTGEINIAKFETVDVDFSNTKSIRKKIHVQKDCIYTGALNVKNAVRHFKKMFVQVSKKATV